MDFCRRRRYLLSLHSLPYYQELFRVSIAILESSMYNVEKPFIKEAGGGLPAADTPA